MTSWKEWIKDAGIRAVKTVAQTAIGMLTVESVRGMTDVDWIAVGSASLLAGIICLLMSLTKLPEKKTEE